MVGVTLRIQEGYINKPIANLNENDRDGKIIKKDLKKNLKNYYLYLEVAHSFFMAQSQSCVFYFEPFNVRRPFKKFP